MPKKNRTSSIWHFFKEVADDHYQCNLCFKTLSIKNGVTFNLVRHYKSKHPLIDIKKGSNGLTSETTTTDIVYSIDLSANESQEQTLTSYQPSTSSKVLNNSIICQFTCGICFKVFTGKSLLKIECEDCKKLFHPGCCKLSRADLESFATVGLVWRCEPCATERRKILRMEIDGPSFDNSTFEDILLELHQIKEEYKKDMQNLNVSYESLKSKLDENNDLLQKLTEIQPYKDQINKLLEENASLKIKNSELEQRLQCEVIECDQYS